MLQLMQIDAFYGMSHALYGLTLSIDAGETVCLLGRNGAGKTTTIKSVMGLVEVRSGEILFRGEPLLGRRTHEISQLGVGYVPEERRIFRDLTVVENLIVGQRHGKKSNKIWSMEGVFFLFPTLKRLSHRKGGTLSGGEQQMLAIARTLMGSPDILLLDEPSEGLAPMVVKSIQEQVLRLKADHMPILLSEQNVRFATSVGDSVYIIEKGQIKLSGKAKDLLEDEAIRTTYLGI
jgi:branched-chain amino acid transport system ATP-binding protein